MHDAGFIAKLLFTVLASAVLPFTVLSSTVLHRRDEPRELEGVYSPNARIGA